MEGYEALTDAELKDCWVWELQHGDGSETDEILAEIKRRTSQPA